MGKVWSMQTENSLEYRKLQVTGGSTYIVSLPRKWIKDHGLTQSDVVGVEYLGTGEIQITPNEIKKLNLNIQLFNVKII